MSWPSQKYVKFPFVVNQNIKPINGVATNALSIGDGAGYISQGANSIAIGNQAGQFTQGDSCVAIGYLAGENTQSQYAVAVGFAAGENNRIKEMPG